MIRLGAFIVLVLAATAVLAGAYAFSDYPLDDPQPYAPNIVVHPHLYTGTGGALSIGVCLTPTAEAFIAQDLEYAVRVWNDRIARTGNCQGPCTSPNGDATPPFSSYPLSTLIHELGHCAFGLDHVNDVVPPASHFDFTVTRNNSNITPGVDGVPGSRDDVVTPLPGALNVHWFRDDDNDPIVVDSVVINSDSYSRNYLILSSIGSRWPASANSQVGALLGAPGTQSVMVSNQPLNSYFKRLAADDTNTLRFAMTGLLTTPSEPGDDYSPTISVLPDCTSAQIEVEYFPFVPASSVVGKCDATITPINSVHYRLGTPGANPRVKISINATPMAGFPIPDTPIDLVYSVFLDDFEAGATSSWSDVEP